MTLRVEGDAERLGFVGLAARRANVARRPGKP
jgi:hypothetical protein